MRRILLSIALAASTSSAFGLERSVDFTPMLGSRPQRPIRLEKRGRMPASVAQIREEQEKDRRDLDSKLKVGSWAIVRNSTGEWNDEVVRVVARFDDGSRRVELSDGRQANIRFENLNTLAPETDKCCKSHGVDICRNEQVYHPVPSTSVGVPLGRVRRIFENCTALVRDGLDFVYSVSQIGKPVDCSPQKESVCVGKVVFVEGFRNGRRYEFEGPVDQVFTNGTILVRTGLWLMPAEATAVKVQMESLHSLPGEATSGAVITSRDGQRKIFVPTHEEIEPFDANDTQRTYERGGLSIPAR